MYYMRSRWYDPQARRFLSEDPIGIAGGSDLYTFGGNDPVNYFDPSGTCAYLQRPIYNDGSLGPSSMNYVPVGEEIIDSHQGARWCGCDGNTWVNSPTDLADCHGNTSLPPITTSGSTITAIGPSAPPPNQPACPLQAPSGQYTIGRNAVALFQPQMATDLTAAFESLNAQGIVPMITSGFRNASDQLRMIQGGSGLNPAAHVSWHEVGMAVDLNSRVSNFSDIENAMAAQGLVWGGTFHTKPDIVHFQIPAAGTRPSAALVQACGGQ